MNTGLTILIGIMSFLALQVKDTGGNFVFYWGAGFAWFYVAAQLGISDPILSLASLAIGFGFILPGFNATKDAIRKRRTNND